MSAICCWLQKAFYENALEMRANPSENFKKFLFMLWALLHFYSILTMIGFDGKFWGF
jgi:hypothetical protein